VTQSYLFGNLGKTSKFDIFAIILSKKQKYILIVNRPLHNSPTDLLISSIWKCSNWYFETS